MCTKVLCAEIYVWKTLFGVWVLGKIPVGNFQRRIVLYVQIRHFGTTKHVNSFLMMGSNLHSARGALEEARTASTLGTFQATTFMRFVRYYTYCQAQVRSKKSKDVRITRQVWSIFKTSFLVSLIPLAWIMKLV